MTIQLDGIANERELWVPVSPEVVGEPTLSLGIFTGTAILRFNGTGPDFIRDSLQFSVGQVLVGGAQVQGISAIGSLASIANEGEAINSGWAVDAVVAALDPGTRRFVVTAQLAVRDSDGSVQRISYEVNAVVLFPAIQVVGP